jgi:pyroglutamyl-peptidase
MLIVLFLYFLFIVSFGRIKNYVVNTILVFMTSNIILTGFEPFGRFKKNPSQDVALALDETVVGSYRIKGFTVPYDSRGIELNLLQKIRTLDPTFVLMMGQSFDAKQQRILLEQRARNYVDYEVNNLYDNTGYRPRKGKIVPQGPEYSETVVVVDSLVTKLQRSGVPISISRDAGYNFCNETYYHALYHGFPVLFAHLAPYPEQTKGNGGLAFGSLKEYVKLIVTAMI